jgi:hypothetical protein
MNTSGAPAVAGDDRSRQNAMLSPSAPARLPITLSMFKGTISEPLRLGALGSIDTW